MSESTDHGALIASAKASGDAIIAAVSGEVDLNNSPELRSALLSLIGRHSPRRLILNLGKVPYMDSSAIAVLVELLRKLGRGGKLILTDLQPRVKGLLEIARLDSIFIIAKDEQEAMSK
jgi:anti-sigma B factor antagonist